MNSVYHTDKYLQVFYDLKGSVLGREAKPGQDVLKDNDLRQRLPEEAMSFNPELRARIRAQLVADCDFLRKMKIMDYSMLIGIHHIPPKQPPDERAASIATTGFRLRERQSSHRNHQRKPSSENVATKTVQFELADDNSTTHSDSHHSASGGVAGNGAPRVSIAAEELKADKIKRESKLANQQSDSTKKLMNEVRESTTSISNFEYAGLLDEEDDCSYLDGSGPCNDDLEYQKSINRYLSHPKYDDIELKKEQTIEQIYWPFHRFYDINGFRRMKPKSCFRCNSHPCKCEGPTRLLKAWNIPEFVPPLSNRKDGGLMMDTTGLDVPLVWHSPTGDRLYEGKIFFMGIIDILQQYNIRKRVETAYRKIEVKIEPSCVHPDEYAERFIRFFDEYSQKCVPAKRPVLLKRTGNEEEKTEIETSISNGIGGEKVKVDVTESMSKLPARRVVVM